jgi:hypothetical protein
MSCPFRVGDLVVYSPDDRQYGLEAMSSSRLERGKAYRVEAIQDSAYVVVEGHPHPGGGLHWSNFKPAPPGSA